ncbi:3-isopropylmalate dehydrogenase [Chryseobacterium indologenes]|uniref:3-isopropylmalate dehydrogenase n=1 Tax=Chryseobacterium TaxID=59732 RepID=UPI0003E076A6|nr:MULTISPECIES: 3-isopropylmalate dehydrogenase [Chryseobacterium]ASE61104.1 3-isopropylmalate dehydrogenase [Chryseobacterium indologenes]ATN05187.1 3-isopropylmalate dehydrogenase [Chryseobacterium indologenes]AYY86058.1 3-isopropylmalate dehydrogenase [Chryseobacterium indologenes]AYZ35829.1 3-isopropylmalate dehydrogenase [Chryseobacterium indologenes]MBF6644606.1 3-isopropylmalate dehydrogenase [Chryseobacterium indologenes]
MSDKYFKIAVLPGDGIGPEIINESIKILDVIAEVFEYKFQFDYGLIGADAIFKTGDPLPEETLKICRESDAVLFGAIGDPSFDNNPEAKVRPEQGLLKLRKELGLFANLRPLKTYASLIEKSPLKREIIEGADIQIFRELVSGIYFGEKFTDPEGNYAYDICKYSREDILPIAHMAFQEAQKRNKKLTLIDKANVLDTSRLWRKICQEIAQEYPDVQLDYMFVDNAAMQLILNPKQFDVILTENMFGDIISDEASVIGGSIGLLPSASVGEKNALFEPIHGSYPQAKGKGIANPVASILSVAMMLDHLNLKPAADKLRQSVEHAIENKYVTIDLNTKQYYSTSEVGSFIADHIRYSEKSYYNFENVKIGKSTIV